MQWQVIYITKSIDSWSLEEFGGRQHQNVYVSYTYMARESHCIETKAERLLCVPDQRKKVSRFESN